jgi:hypothetical protein
MNVAKASMNCIAIGNAPLLSQCEPRSDQIRTETTDDQSKSQWIGWAACGIHILHELICPIQHQQSIHVTLGAFAKRRALFCQEPEEEQCLESLPFMGSLNSTNRHNNCMTYGYLRWRGFSERETPTPVGEDCRRNKLALGRASRSVVRPRIEVDSTQEHSAQGSAPVLRCGTISVHLNTAYQWNGDSILGSAVAGTKDKLANDYFYSAGLEWAIVPKVTLAFDYLGD